MFLPFKYIQIYFMFSFVLQKEKLENNCVVSSSLRASRRALCCLSVLEGELHLTTEHTRQQLEFIFYNHSRGFLVYIRRK